MADYRIISSDNHIVEPPDLWTSRENASSRTGFHELSALRMGQIIGPATAIH